MEHGDLVESLYKLSRYVNAAGMLRLVCADARLISNPAIPRLVLLMLQREWYETGSAEPLDYTKFTKEVESVFWSYGQINPCDATKREWATCAKQNPKAGAFLSNWLLDAAPAPVEIPTSYMTEEYMNFVHPNLQEDVLFQLTTHAALQSPTIKPTMETPLELVWKFAEQGNPGLVHTVTIQDERVLTSSSASWNDENELEYIKRTTRIPLFGQFLTARQPIEWTLNHYFHDISGSVLDENPQDFSQDMPVDFVRRVFMRYLITNGNQSLLSLHAYELGMLRFLFYLHGYAQPLIFKYLRVIQRASVFDRTRWPERAGAETTNMYRLLLVHMMQTLFLQLTLNPQELADKKTEDDVRVYRTKIHQMGVDFVRQWYYMIMIPQQQGATASRPFICLHPQTNRPIWPLTLEPSEFETLCKPRSTMAGSFTVSMSPLALPRRGSNYDDMISHIDYEVSVFTTAERLVYSDNWYTKAANRSAFHSTWDAYSKGIHQYNDLTSGTFSFVPGNLNSADRIYLALTRLVDSAPVLRHLLQISPGRAMSVRTKSVSGESVIPYSSSGLALAPEFGWGAFCADYKTPNYEELHKDNLYGIKYNEMCNLHALTTLHKSDDFTQLLPKTCDRRRSELEVALLHTPNEQTFAERQAGILHWVSTGGNVFCGWRELLKYHQIVSLGFFLDVIPLVNSERTRKHLQSLWEGCQTLLNAPEAAVALKRFAIPVLSDRQIQWLIEGKDLFKGDRDGSSHFKQSTRTGVRNRKRTRPEDNTEELEEEHLPKKKQHLEGDLGIITPSVNKSETRTTLSIAKELLSQDESIESLHRINPSMLSRWGERILENRANNKNRSSNRVVDVPFVVPNTANRFVRHSPSASGIPLVALPAHHAEWERMVKGDATPAALVVGHRLVCWGRYNISQPNSNRKDSVVGRFSITIFGPDGTPRVFATTHHIEAVWNRVIRDPLANQDSDSFSSSACTHCGIQTHSGVSCACSEATAPIIKLDPIRILPNDWARS